MDTTVDDSYRDCVKTLLFLNPGVELNTRGLCKYHGMKDRMFMDFHDTHNPCLLILPIPGLSLSTAALLLLSISFKSLRMSVPAELNNLFCIFVLLYPSFVL
jgi:hypothetical protein